MIEITNDSVTRIVVLVSLLLMGIAMAWALIGTFGLWTTTKVKTKTTIKSKEYKPNRVEWPRPPRPTEDEPHPPQPWPEPSNPEDLHINGGSIIKRSSTISVGGKMVTDIRFLHSAPEPKEPTITCLLCQQVNPQKAKFCRKCGKTPTHGDAVLKLRYLINNGNGILHETCYFKMRDDPKKTWIEARSIVGDVDPVTNTRLQEGQNVIFEPANPNSIFGETK